MNKIDINKKYKTRLGFPVRIYSIDAGGEYPVHAAYFYEDEWIMESFTNNGRYAVGHTDNDEDLIEIGKYDHIKIDDQVVAWDHVGYNNKTRCHFGGINEDAKILTWGNGKTSFTHEEYDGIDEWDNCELYIEDKEK